jgi:adenosylhomocysteine nucleosidase
MSELEELADFGIITVIPEELDAVLDIFGLRRSVTYERNYYYGSVVSGQGPQQFVVCAECRDQGNVSASVVASDLITRWKPNYLLVVGIAGGVSPSVKLGDVVTHDELLYYELAKDSENGRKIRLMKMEPPSPFLLDTLDLIRNENTWWEKIAQPRPDGESSKPELHRGWILSGEKLLGNPRSEELMNLLNEYDRVLAVEMESGGIAKAVWEKRKFHRAEFLVVRGISDYCNALGNQETRDMWRVYAARSAASVALAIVQETPHQISDEPDYGSSDEETTWVCARCNAPVSDSDKYCRVCGAVL